MNYNTMDYMPNGIIVSNIRESKIIYINKIAKQILKIDEKNKSIVKSLGELISDERTFENFKKRILSDIEQYKKSEGIIYLKTLENNFIEVSFCCVWEDEKKGFVSYIFKKATEVIGESQVSFKELAEYLPSGIIVMDIENKLSITYANNEHYKILGIEGETEQTTYLLRDFIFEEDVNWVLSEIHLTLAKKEDVDIEFRMKTKSGVAKWVRLFGRANISSSGEKLFYSSIKDLSQRRSLNDKLHLERVMFHKITELTKETLFRLDLQTNIIHFLGKEFEVFGENNVFENFPQSIINLEKIHKDDLHAHASLIKYFKEGTEKPIELRYEISSNFFEWYRITYSFVKDINNKPISVIGKVSNIHNQKMLEEQAKTDLLTGLYNKITTEQEANKLINFRKDKTHALFIIDIDNFKAINDNLGHHFGDMVLTGISSDIKNSFRKNDILGRIGGDEFIVLMRDASDTSIIVEKAELLCRLLNKTFTGNNKSYTISASIGISMYPTDGTTYEELYKKSDTALYEIKRTGKDGYKQFYKELQRVKSSFVTKELDGNRIRPVFINNIIVSTVLNLLYETKDLNTSLVSILEYLGAVFKVDKCYIFETSDDGKIYNDNYRWNKNNKYTELQHIKYSQLSNILKEANMDGIFYTNDILKIKDPSIIEILKNNNVESIFLVESLKHHDESMILGLEDCQLKRLWSEEEIVTLLHIGRLIFTAINNYNIINKLSKNLKKDI